MAELKTKLNNASVDKFIKSLNDDRAQADCRSLTAIMRKTTGAEPKMWGTSIVGFGSYHYKYASGREGDWFQVGFSPRKQNLTVYIMEGFEAYQGLLKRLGKHTTAKSCLYIKRLDDVDLRVLSQIVTGSVKALKMRERTSSLKG